MSSHQPRIASQPVQDVCSHLLILDPQAEMNANTTTAATRITSTIFLAQQYV
jgi:hypothetical protein